METTIKTLQYTCPNCKLRLNKDFKECPFCDWENKALIHNTEFFKNVKPKEK